jgi:hypothetical protein
VTTVADERSQCEKYGVLRDAFGAICERLQSQTAETIPAAAGDSKLAAPSMPLVANTGEVLAPADAPHPEISSASD